MNQLPPQTPPGQEPRKAKGNGFWATSGGLVTLVAVGFLIFGGITGGLIYALTRNGNGTYTESVRKAWTQLDEVAGEIDLEAESVMDLTSSDSPDLIADFQKLLDQKDGDLGSILTDIKPLSPSDNEKEAYDNLVATIESFRDYLQETADFLDLFTTDINDTKLNSALGKMSDLAVKTRDSANAFISGSKGIEPSSFNPFVLQLSTFYGSELVKARNEQAGKKKQESEQSAVEATNDARTALQNILNLYVSQGWDAVVPFMTQELYVRYQNANPPWDQVSYIVETAAITNFQLIDENKIIFTVQETHKDGDETSTETGGWEMVKSGDKWLINNNPYAYNQ